MFEKRQRRGRDGRPYSVYRVRWHDADGAERNKTLPRGSTRRDAEAFERYGHVMRELREAEPASAEDQIRRAREQVFGSRKAS